MLFRDWFSKEIPRTNARVIVAGKKGAYLEGAEHLDYDEAFSFLTEPISKTHPVQSHYHNNKSSLTQYLKDLYRALSEAPQKFQEVVDLCAIYMDDISDSKAVKRLQKLLLKASQKK